MAVSRFDKPTSQPLINTYVPIPFQELLQAGVAKQERYNTNLSTIDTYSDALLRMRALPIDKPLLQQKQDQFNKTVEPYLTADLSDPTITRRLQQDLRSIARDPILQNINASYQRYQEGLQKARERYEAGDLSAPSQRWFMLDSAYSDYATSGGAASGNIYNYNPVAKYVDIEGELTEKYLKMPTQKLMDVGRQWGMNYITKETIEQRRPEIISQLVQAELQSNPVYREQLRIDAMYNSAQNGIDPNEYLSSVIGTMSNRVGAYAGVNNIERDVSADPTALNWARLGFEREKEASKMGGHPILTPLQGMEVEPSVDVDNIVDALRPRGRSDIDPSIVLSGPSMAFSRRTQDYNTKNLDPTGKMIVQNVIKSLRPNLSNDRINKIIEDPKSTNSESLMEEVAEVVQNNYDNVVRMITPFGIPLSEDQSEEYNRFVFGSKTPKFDFTKDGTTQLAGAFMDMLFVPAEGGEPIRGVDLMKKLKDEGLKAGAATVSSKVDPNNPYVLTDRRFSDALQVNFGSGEKVKTYYATDPLNLIDLNPTQWEALRERTSQVESGLIRSGIGYQTQQLPYQNVPTVEGTNMRYDPNIGFIEE